jgi:site-specific DNA recombinase
VSRSKKPVNGSGAVIYVRVSTDEQVMNFSLATQEKSCRDYCERSGFAVANVFREEGASAKTTNRPEMTRMVNWLREHAARQGIGYLVVYRVDRFTRDVLSGFQLEEELKSLGVVLRSTAEVIDETSSGQLNKIVSTGFAQWDNIVRGERTRNGMVAGMEAGNYMFRPPPGYMGGERRKGLPSLIPDPEVAPIVQEVYEQLAFGGMAQSEALEFAIARGLKGYAGNEISKTTFHRMVTNPVYVGWNVSEALEVSCRGDWEPLVSDEVWEAAQKAPRKPSDKPLGKKRNLNDPSFPLRRIVRCAECGTACTASNSTSRSGARYAYYRCRTKGCSGFNVRVEAFEEQFISFLASQSLSDEGLTLFDAVMKDVWRKRTQKIRSARTAHETRLAELDASILKVTEAMIMDRSIDREACASLLDGYKAARTQVADQLADTHLEVPSIEECVDFARKALTDLPRIWNHIKPAKRAGFTTALYPSGLIYTDGAFGTAETPWHIRVPDGSDAQNGEKVPPTGFEPV